MTKSRDKEIYLKQLPATRKWLNECSICHTIGYKPELPETIYPGPMAKSIRSLFAPLTVNDMNISEDCARHWESRETKNGL